MPPVDDGVSGAPSRRRSIALRELGADDGPAAVDLLARGFPERSRALWQRAIDRLAARSIPDGVPRFGYGLVADGRLVGVLLIIASRSDDGILRANVSSWYVEPPYRSYSTLLVAAPARLRDLTLFNISPAPGTIEIAHATGFRAYVHGRFRAVAAVAPAWRGATIRRITGEDGANSELARLAGLGCLCFEVTRRGETYPFAFVRRRTIRGIVPCAVLVYCRSVDDVVRCAGGLGRALLRLGLPLVMLDANGPVDGLVGWYAPGQPKLYRGDHPPRIGDLSQSEIVLFGLT